jgi:hypothetical protein
MFPVKPTLQAPLTGQALRDKLAEAAECKPILEDESFKAKFAHLPPERKKWSDSQFRQLNRLLFETDRVDQHESVLRSDCRAVAVRLAFRVVTVPDEEIVSDLMIRRDRLHKSNLRGSGTRLINIVMTRLNFTITKAAGQRQIVLN